VTEPEPPKTPPFEVGDAFLQRLERIVVPLLRRQFRSAQDIWKLQLDLYRLQREVQASITKRKSDPRSKASSDEIQALRSIRWHARAFGDTLAWAFHHGDRSLLYPMSFNEKVPIEPWTNEPSPLVIAAEGLSPRLGFPLLHDITDILRIGDVSFFRAGLERPMTVELKASVVSRERDGDQVKIQYQMSAVWPAGAEHAESLPVDPGDPAPMAQATPRRRQAGLDSRRFRKQLERMSDAHAQRTADLGKPTKIGGRPALFLRMEADDSPTHWPVIRRLIRRARRTGYASGSAEQSTMYVVAYSADGFEADDPAFVRAGTDLGASDIWYADTNRNMMRITPLVDPSQRGPHRWMPYFLYPIPLTSRVDILHGRLIILSILNVGRLADAIQAEGLRVEMPGRHANSMSVLLDVPSDEGSYLVDLANLEENIAEMIMEGGSIQSVAALAAHMADNIRDLLPDMMRVAREDEDRSAE